MEHSCCSMVIRSCLLQYILWAVVFVTSTFNRKISLVITVCAVWTWCSIMFHCSTVFLFFFCLGMLQPLMSGLAFSPSPTLSGSQGITTRCSKNGAITDCSFKVPSSWLQSFLYWHQYGEHHQNTQNTITKLGFCDGSPVISLLGSGQSWNESWIEGSSKVLQVSGAWNTACWCHLNPLFSLQTKHVLGENAAFWS